MKFVSLIPELMRDKEWTPTMLDDALREQGLKVSWPIVLGLNHGEIPKTTYTLLKLCSVFDCQPNELIVFVR